jgi:hypothetical protein
MKIAIIGAGAAGCFAAANIPKCEGVEVAVFEKTGKALQKVKASGGGRCNVTHECFDVPELITKYPRGRQLLRKSLYRFGPKETKQWFEQRGVQLKTEADGRVFPVTDSSQAIIDCLWREMMNNNVHVYFHKQVEAIKRENDQFVIQFADQSSYIANAILIAAGGFPKTGQYNWLTALGHTIQTPVPSLFTFNMPGNPITALMGVSVPDATVKVAGTKIMQHGALLITHWGMSGPAILKTSAVAARELAERNYEFSIIVNWLGEMDDAGIKEAIEQLRQERGKQFVVSSNPFNLPRRMWEHIAADCSIKEDTRWGDLAAGSRNKLVEHLIRDSYTVKGKTTFKEEFVTCGGISLSEVDPDTMESRKVPGLYFAGEIMDVDGVTGGYNFQHAWCSGWIAALALADKSKAENEKPE